MLWNFIAWLVSRPLIASWIISYAKRTPYRHITDYMDRWWLFNGYRPAPHPHATERERHTPKYRWCPISIGVHHIKRADDDRHDHDHPCNGRTIIMRRGYVEKKLDGSTFLRSVGSTAVLRYGEYHRIAHVQEGGAWTLFIRGPWRGDWGFYVPGSQWKGNKIPHGEYFKRYLNRES